MTGNISQDGPFVIDMIDLFELDHCYTALALSDTMLSARHCSLYLLFSAGLSMQRPDPRLLALAARV